MYMHKQGNSTDSSGSFSKGDWGEPEVGSHYFFGAVGGSRGGELAQGHIFLWKGWCTQNSLAKVLCCSCLGQVLLHLQAVVLYSPHAFFSLTKQNNNNKNRQKNPPPVKTFTHLNFFLSYPLLHSWKHKKKLWALIHHCILPIIPIFPQCNLKSDDLNQSHLETMGVCVLTLMEFGLTWDCKISKINAAVMLLRQWLEGQEIPKVEGFPWN